MYRILCLLTTERSVETSLQGCLMEGKNPTNDPKLALGNLDQFHPRAASEELTRIMHKLLLPIVIP